jgi:hypothetical protein
LRTRPSSITFPFSKYKGHEVHKEKNLVPFVSFVVG